jgi:AraC-like DNA-binding protein
MASDYRNTIHSHFVLPLLHAAAARGYQPERFLAPAGLHPDVLDEPGLRLTSDQYNAVVKKLWITLADENAGIGPKPSQLGSFELMCEMALVERTLRDVFNKIFRIYSVFVDTMSWSLQADQGCLSVGFRYTNFEDRERILTEWTLLAWHRFACWAADVAFPLQQVDFNYPKPAHWREYQGIFGCPLAFNQPIARMEFDARYLALPVLKSRNELKEFIGASPGILLARPVSERHFRVRIRRLVMSRLESTRSLIFPSLNEVAARFNLTTQTLRRRLKSENTSYHDLKNDIRRDVAIEFLSRRNLSIQEISGIIGYHDASAFSRAFKEWTGMSPNVYRAEIVPDSA